MARCKFIGDGAGIPGLPHEVSEEEAEALGAAEILKAAIKNGSYIADDGRKTKDDGNGVEPASKVLAVSTATERNKK